MSIMSDFYPKFRLRLILTLYFAFQLYLMNFYYYKYYFFNYGCMYIVHYFSWPKLAFIIARHLLDNL